MTKTNKRIIVLLCIVLFLGVLLSACIIPKSAAYAQTKSYFSAEQYTEKDELLNSDGTTGSRTIRDFAASVKAAKDLAIIEDITQVIPLEYLETIEGGTYAYMGREYGFYIYNTSSEYSATGMLYTLLIDFTCEQVDKSDDCREFRVKVEPILQQCFMRCKDLGETVWVKYDDDSYKFYVSNPDFCTEATNANNLNYGDNGYSKFSDEGLVIEQSRLNYKFVELPSTASVLATISAYTFDAVMDDGLAMYDLIYQTDWSAIKDTFDSIVALGQVIAEHIQVKTIESNNEKNIATNKSKRQQLDDDKLDSFYRSAKTRMEGDMLLSADNGSYAEMIVVLNDTNYRSRLIQMCTFDIFCKEAVYSKAKKVKGPNGEDRFGFYREGTLFDDQQPHFEIGDDFGINSVPIYLHPKNNQLITFSPKYSGEYSFQVPLGAELKIDGTPGKIDGTPGVKFNLNAGQTYNIEIVNSLMTKIIGSLSCTVSLYSETQSYNISSGSHKIMRYQQPLSEYLRIRVSNPNVKIGILNENLKIVASADSNVALGNFIKGKTYYFLIKNDTAEAVSTNISISNIQSMELGQDYVITAEKKIMSFQNGNVGSSYKLLLNNTDKSNVSITDIVGNSLLTGKQDVDNSVIYTFALGAGEECFINFEQADGSIHAHLFISPTHCRWLINGEPVNSLRVRLKPNASYSIGAEISADGQSFEVINSVNIQTTVADYSFVNGVLRIGNVANSQEIVIIPTIAADLRLVVEIDDMITKITLNHESGMGYDGVISVELGQRIPCESIPVPIRKGYTFLGYYNMKQDSQDFPIQYITNKMVGQNWDVDVDTATLYAHWAQNEYILTFDNGVGSLSRYWYYTMYYGDPFPTDRDFAPKKDGYHFLGYYSIDGDEYYSVTEEMLDDEQGADIYGYNHYYVEGMKFCYKGGDKWERESDLRLYAHWQVLSTPYYVKEVVEGQSYTTSQLIALTHGREVSVSPREISKAEFKYFMLGAKVLSGTTISWTPSLTWNVTTGKIVPTEDLIAVYSPKECVAEGTLITLADGTQVPVETLKGDEMLLVWNMLTGKLDAARIMFIDKDAEALYKVINLGFSDGTTVKVISEHGFWDYDLNKFVYLRSDASNYIGHWFNKGDARVQLTNVEVRDEYTTAYSPVTYGHLCYYVNGMLSMPGGIEGLFNIFDVDPDTMTVNAEAMAQDVATYGLFTYEEFAEILPVSQDVFNAFNGQYLKIAIGKGLISVERLEDLVNRYSSYFDGITMM